MIQQNTKAKSDFVGYFSVKDNERIKNNFIEPKINKFFKIKEIKSYKPIAENAEIADVDLKSKNFDNFFAYFYEYIVDGIHKNKDGKIQIPVTYCITLDKENCSQYCETTDIFYDEICLYNQPVFYFIYIDIQEIFNFLRTH
jgi:hypothetical protein